MVELLWCPDCCKQRYHYSHSDDAPTCRECETELVNPPKHVKAIRKIKQGIAVSVFAGIFIGPIVWVILNIGEKPLYATKTVEVTTTKPYGIIPTISPFLFIWLFIGFIIWSLSGGLPRSNY